MDYKKLSRVLDSLESKSMHRARELLRSLGMSATDSERFVSEYLPSILPNLKGTTRKYTLGIINWIISDQLDIEDSKMLSKVNTALKLLSRYPYDELYDKEFNNLSPEVVLQSLNIPLTTTKSSKEFTNKDYTIHKIDSYEQAQKWCEYVSDWCIIQSDLAFKEHTIKGTNQFYFLVRNDIDSVPKEMQDNYPYDDYGMSMIAVSFDIDGNLASSTSRWNFDDRNDDYLSMSDLKQLVGAKELDRMRKHL